jgi:hypothetical protein
VNVQIAYYFHWREYGDSEKVSRKEINMLIQLGFENCPEEVYNLVVIYNLTYSDFIWDFLTIAFELIDKDD